MAMTFSGERANLGTNSTSRGILSLQGCLCFYCSMAPAAKTVSCQTGVGSTNTSEHPCSALESGSSKQNASRTGEGT